jgi:TPR repeat protein
MRNAEPFAMNWEKHASTAKADRSGAWAPALRRARICIVALIACLPMAGVMLAGPATTAFAQTPQVKSPEVTFWESVRDSKDPAEIEAYLSAYPHGQFALLARIRLDKLKAGTADVRPVPGKPPQPAMQHVQPGKPVKMTAAVIMGTRAETQRAVLGVSVGGLDATIAKSLGLENNHGAIVTAVTPNGAAEAAGILLTDVIVEIDGRPVTSMNDLRIAVGAATPGSRARVVFWRLADNPQVLLTRLRHLADQGDTAAALSLGWLVAVLPPPSRDPALAARMFRTAADKGQSAAMLLLGILYRGGAGVAKNEAEAVKWVRKAADKDNPAAMSTLGSMYQNGQGVAKDLAEAARWYQKAAEKGRADAMYALGALYANGKGVAKDEAIAVVWYRQAAAKHNIDAIAALGGMYENGFGVYQDYAEAIRWYRQAADLNNSNAMFRLGTMALDGRGMAKDDAEAVNWFRKSAKLNNAAAMVALGLMYSSGRGINRDDVEAARLFRKGADMGNSAGMFYLGLAYARGQGVAKDDAESARWYRKAAEAGDVAAMHNLGDAYDKGRGVPKNAQLAAQWVFKALSRGSEFSINQMVGNANAYTSEFRRELQRLLAQAGVYDGKADGHFGPSTKAAIQALAKKTGRPQ